jgi:hypothetical protein
VSTEPMPAKVFAKAFGDAVYGQTAGVCSHDAAGLAYCLHFLEQVAFDL